jgi:hypothetical protein
MSDERSYLLECASDERNLAALSKDMAEFRLHMDRAREFDNLARGNAPEQDDSQAGLDGDPPFR